jgi:hypothetical protein
VGVPLRAGRHRSVCDSGNFEENEDDYWGDGTQFCSKNRLASALSRYRRRRRLLDFLTRDLRARVANQPNGTQLEKFGDKQAQGEGHTVFPTLGGRIIGGRADQALDPDSQGCDPSSNKSSNSTSYETTLWIVSFAYTASPFWGGSISAIF